MWKVETFDADTLGAYRYVVIFARYKGKWLYARHKERTTWETAGGHVEPGETVLDAAKRELYEETGAAVFSVRPMIDYRCGDEEEYADGQAFVAQIEELGPIPAEFEMAEIMLCQTYPPQLTYPGILPVLFEEIQKRLQNKPEVCF